MVAEAFLPWITLLVSKGSVAVTELVTVVEETGLLEGVAPADELIKGLLVVAVAWVTDVPVLLVELLLLLVWAEFVFVFVLVLLAVLVCDDCETDSALTGGPALSRAE